MTEPTSIQKVCLVRLMSRHPAPRLAGVSGSAGQAPAWNGMRHTGKWMTNSLSERGTWNPTSFESATCSRM